MAAAKVGGIHANNSYPADFIRDNLAVQINVIDAAYRQGTRKLLFLGSSCIYPKHAPQPMNEDCLLTGPLEPTNEWYAIAKIAGIKMCQAYRRQYGFDAICADADQPLRAGRQFRPRELARAAGADPQDSRGQAGREQVGRGLGHRHAAPRIPVRRRSGRRGGISDAETIRAQGPSTSASARTSRSGNSPSWWANRRDSGASWFDTSKPDGTPRKLLDVGRLSCARVAARAPLRVYEFAPTNPSSAAGRGRARRPKREWVKPSVARYARGSCDS